MEDNQPYTADDLARAALLRIVPSGYRLIDASDERFTGIRDRFVRLALKHLGPRPSLIGFTEPGVDPQEAARAAAVWAAENLTPNAIQRRVAPGVLVIAVDGSARAGPVDGAAVSSAVWTIAPGGVVEARGRPPGSPSAGLVRDVVKRLERGEAAPGIGQVDYVERNLMYGRGRRARAAGLSGTAVLLIVVGLFFGLRFLPALFAGATGAAQGQNNPCARGCVVVTPSQSHNIIATLSIGQTSSPILFRGAEGCPEVSNPQVLRQVACDKVGGTDSGFVTTYQGLASGRTDLGIGIANGNAYTVTVVVQ
ncbi:MAG: hypothetical protein WBD38_02630 [Candidatus Dormiibacterota bacterium]